MGLDAAEPERLHFDHGKETLDATLGFHVFMVCQMSPWGAVKGGVKGH